MRNFKDIILEKLKISNKSNYTLRNFIEWYINEGPDCELTVQNVRYLDFTKSPSATWRKFDGLSSNIAKFLLKHLDDNIDLTEDINKEEKSITYTFYIDDILFVVLAVYNTRMKYPAFFDQYFNESLISEKLKINNKYLDWTKTVVPDVDVDTLLQFAKLFIQKLGDKTTLLVDDIYNYLDITLPENVTHNMLPSKNGKYKRVKYVSYLIGIECYEHERAGYIVTLLYGIKGRPSSWKHITDKSLIDFIKILGNDDKETGRIVFDNILKKMYYEANK